MKRLLLLSAIVATALVIGACSSDDSTTAACDATGTTASNEFDITIFGNPEFLPASVVLKTPRGVPAKSVLGSCFIGRESKDREGNGFSGKKTL